MNIYKSKQLLAFLMAILLSASGCEAKIKNKKITTAIIYGNCGMCKERIETAANKAGEVVAIWDVNSKIITLTFDSVKTNADAILKRVADAGHDNDKFIANNTVYKTLPECCQYDRKTTQMETASLPIKYVVSSNQNNPTTSINTTDIKKQLNNLLLAYYEIKDALIATNGSQANLKAKAFLSTLSLVSMDAMTTEQHKFYMPISNKIKFDAEHIAETQDAAHQRDHFNDLSNNVWTVITYFKANEATMNKDYCPMKKMYWISNKTEIENPYYGSEMLGCGSIKETVK